MITAEHLRRAAKADGFNNPNKSGLESVPIVDRESARQAASLAWKAGWDAEKAYGLHDVAQMYWNLARTAWLASTDDTVITVNCWLEQEKYREQCIRFIDHHRGWHDIIVVDNGSDPQLCAEFAVEHGVRVDNLQPCLRRSGKLPSDYPDYPYAWRNVLYRHNILDEGHRKIIVLESDFFILSKRLMQYIDDLDDGWTSLWCEKHHFPETAIQIIVQGCHEFSRYCAELAKYKPSFSSSGLHHVQEIILPVTRIATQFVGDRYGVSDTVPLKGEAPDIATLDWWGQWPIPECVPLRDV